MSTAPWDEYFAVPSTASAATLVPVLKALFQGVQSPHSPQPSIETRRRLLSLLLTSLTPTSPSAPPLEKEQLDPTLSLIKLFGRAPAGSEELSREKALQTLLAYSGLARCGKLLRRPGGVGGFRSEQQRRRRGRSEDRPTGIVELVSSEDEEDLDEDEDSELNVTTPMPTRLNANSSDPLTHSESEALRTLCNVLMLHPSSRVAFPSALSNQDVRGLVRLVAVPGAGFLAGRLLFLLTSQQSEWVRELAEGSELVERMEEYASHHLTLLSSTSPAAYSELNGPAPNRTDVLREHFKLAYNLMLQYGRQAPTSTPLRRHLSDEGSTTASDSEPGSRSSSPMPSDTKTLHEKKKRFWSSTSSSSGSPLSGSPDLLSLPTLPDAVPFAPVTSTRAKSPRRITERLKSAASRVRGNSNGPLPPTPPSATTNSATADGLAAGEISLEKAQYFIPLFPLYLRLACTLEISPRPRGLVNPDLNPQDLDPSPLVRNALNTLLNFPIKMEELGLELSWLQPVSLLSTSLAAKNPYLDLVPSLPARLLEVLSWLCDVHFPMNVHGKKLDGTKSASLPAHPDELVPRGGASAGKAEEMIAPVVLLLRKIALLREGAEGLKEVILPMDIDRTLPLERHKSLTGHLVRLLSSILLPNTAYGVGELLYNLCDRDPTTLSQEIGYGNAAGFLQNRGELIPPPPPVTQPQPQTTTTETKRRSSEEAPAGGINLPHGRAGGRGRGGGFTGESSGKSKMGASTPINSSVKNTPLPPLPSTSAKVVNPITGAYYDTSDKGKEGEVQMSEDDKLREAEKLYVLFERMEKTGVMGVENPIKKAQKEGKLVYGDGVEEEERKREEEEKEEKEVEDEMRRYRERKKKVAESLAAN